MADYALSRQRLFAKQRRQDDGDPVIIDTGWELAAVPGLGEVLCPSDFTGNLTNYDSEREVTGIVVMDDQNLLSAGGNGGTGGSVRIAVGS